MFDNWFGLADYGLFVAAIVLVVGGLVLIYLSEGPIAGWRKAITNVAVLTFLGGIGLGVVGCGKAFLQTHPDYGRVLVYERVAGKVVVLAPGATREIVVVQLSTGEVVAAEREKGADMVCVVGDLLSFEFRRDGTKNNPGLGWMKDPKKIEKPGENAPASIPRAVD